VVIQSEFSVYGRHTSDLRHFGTSAEFGTKVHEALRTQN